MVGGRNNNILIANIVLTISLIVLSIGLIIFIVENSEMGNLKKMIFSIIFALACIGVAVIIAISRQDAISQDFSSKLKILSSIIIFVAFLLMIVSIVILRNNLEKLGFIFSTEVKLLYLGGVLGLLGMSVANIYLNIQKRAIIGIPSILCALCFSICFLVV